MSVNPYESPLETNTPAITPLDGTSGPWRDGAQLVVAADGTTQLPERCVKTNLPTEGRAVHVKFVWVPNQTAWFLTLGLLGHAIARALYGRKVSLDLPISPQWLAKRRRTQWIGGSMLAFGVLALVLGVAAYGTVLHAGVSEAAAAWLLIIILGGPLVSVLGLVFLAVFDKRIVSIRAVVGDFAWIDGVCPEFLDRLPEWSA